MSHLHNEVGPCLGALLQAIEEHLLGQVALLQGLLRSVPHEGEVQLGRLEDGVAKILSYKMIREWRIGYNKVLASFLLLLIDLPRCPYPTIPTRLFRDMTSCC